MDIGVPIGCGGVPVFPGDVVAGDEEAVVVLPRHLAAEVARDAAEQERLEAFVLEKVDRGAALPGTYPPSPETQRSTASGESDAVEVPLLQAAGAASGAAPQGPRVVALTVRVDRRPPPRLPFRREAGEAVSQVPRRLSARFRSACPWREASGP